VDKSLMNNLLIKTMAFSKSALILFVNNADLLRTICHRPYLKSRQLRHALSLTVSAASLLAGTLKDHQRLSIKVKLSCPAGTLYADADWQGHVRGTVSDGLLQEPSEFLDDMTIPQLVGDRGVIHIVKDVGMFRHFTGITDMPYRNILDDLSHYYHQSEQTPTCFAIHIGYDDAGQIREGIGVLAQLLPGAPKELMDDIKVILNRLHGISPSMGQGEEFRQTVFRLFDDIEILDELPVRAYCDCNKDMMAPMLFSLGIGELTAACENRESMEISCHLCGNSYVFGPDEIEKLLSRDSK
jgi:molecular chaperone Hsp33